MSEQSDLSKIAFQNPFTNVYGLARTLLALGTLGTLLVTPVSSLFYPVASVSEGPACSGPRRFGAFCVAGAEHLELAKWCAVLVLLVVASGWRPRFTGFLHWWIAFSAQANYTIVDGGDQITAIVTLFLIPLTLVDGRRWHWDRSEDASVLARLVGHTSFWAVRVQMAIVYFHACVGKLKTAEWVDGTAVYYWFLDPQHGSSPWLKSLIEPVVYSPLGVGVVTYGTLVLEYCLAAGLLASRRVQKVLLVAGITFHLGILVVHGLVSFGLAMFGALILYLRSPADTFELGSSPWREHGYRMLAWLRRSRGRRVGDVATPVGQYSAAD
jgi:antimicrobial peptide system SdpB family protein